jgi:hypothetical protein
VAVAPAADAIDADATALRRDAIRDERRASAARPGES